MWLEIFRRYLAMFLIGNIIKWLDDEVDGDHSGYEFFKGGKYPYSLLFLALALLLDLYYSYSLFTAAYMIGMFHIPLQRLPFGLKSYQEMILLVIISLTLVPWRIFFHSIILITTIQLMDDLYDYSYDFRMGFQNYAITFGRGEVLIATLLLMVMAFMISWMNTIIILQMAIFINHLYCHR
ncbi:hypothetical protein [Alkaliphilus serpentinus]|uniref:Uncharacterized protein n=1 Tax=Alkaliphilus serpentinus TaxID=1482731 RepID=A0A833M984_9FIRM|nr:hypothetical protein [Alkaliphilus serpentinus]KAB3527250.1 hypothetical protein F8153_12685 [Alkaliphilus serpentinus]